MFEFLKTLFNPPPPSSTTAKERLRLVLLSDHLSLSPETLAALKADLLAVISRYVEIDSSHADVTFEHRENDVAVLASIPITGVRERAPLATIAASASAATATAIAVAEPEVEAAQPSAAVAPTEPTFETIETVKSPETVETLATNVTTATSATDGSKNEAPSASAAGVVSAASRRRRRKKAQNAASRSNANAQPLGKPAQA